jgi:peptidyl-prolyl cis-trans isomerase B (cyclophilin B)
MRTACSFLLAPLFLLACSSSSSSDPNSAVPDAGSPDTESDGGVGDASDDPQAPKPVSIVLETDLGNIEIELDAAQAPKTVENFLTYVDEKAYDGTLFHRVIPGFMIQGGGFDSDYKQRDTHPAIRNEANNGLKNLRGTIAMARTSAPHSATNQFFINVADNKALDFTAETKEGWGYAVFGKVTTGMDVADKIVAVPTGAGGPFTEDAPLTQIHIKSAHRR